jgi:uncharacterized membrane protein YkvA (DUF1232 family)
MIEKLKRWAHRLKRDAHAVYLVARDPRTPWYVKALAMFVAGYALSPIDLIPDFIPVLGYLDDLIIVPLGLVLVIRLVPSEIMAEHRATADRAADKPISRTAVVVICALWAVAIALMIWAAARYLT